VQRILLALLILLAPGSVMAQSINNNTTQLPDSGSIATTVISRQAGLTYVTDFCSAAETNGTSSSTACVQRAVNALCARSFGSGILYFPVGEYLIDGTVTIGCSGITLQGAGFGDRDPVTSSPLKWNAGTYIHVQGTGSAPAFLAKVTSFTNKWGETNAPSNTGFSYGFTVKDMQFYQYPYNRTGPFVEMDSWQQAMIDHVYMFGPCVGVKIAGGFYVSVNNSIIEGDSPGCDVVQITGSVANHFSTTDVVNFEKVKINTNSGACYAITDRVQTVWWKNTTCETSGSALKSSCPTMTSPLYCPGFFTLYDFEAEGFAGNGSNLINLIDIKDLVDGMKMTDSWLRGSSKLDAQGNRLIVNTLMAVTPQRFPLGNLNLNISNNWLKFAGGACLYLESPNVHVIGNQIYGCNFFNIGASGVEVRANRAVVSGNNFCGGDFLNDVDWQMIPGYVLAGKDYVTFTGNVYSGDVGTLGVGKHNGCSGPVYAPSPGAHTSFTVGNVGP